MPSNQDDLVGTHLVSGITNIAYGVWRSKCCGHEVVLYPGVIFPLCSRHKDGVTEWVLVSTDVLSKPNVNTVRSTRNPANTDAHPSPDRLKDLAVGGALSSEEECAHLRTCSICRSELERFSRSPRGQPKSA